jgi:hypothetical protein
MSHRQKFIESVECMQYLLYTDIKKCLHYSTACTCCNSDSSLETPLGKIMGPEMESHEEISRTPGEL